MPRQEASLVATLIAYLVRSPRMASDPSHDIGTLSAVPPVEFTRRRNELARRLRDEGRREDAAAVRRLKKPSVPLWAVDSVARERADAVRGFIDATDELKPAQLGNREAAADATHAQRRALRALIRSADEILQRGGFTPTPQTLQRISNTLLGAAAHPDARRALLHGQLTEEREAPGFEALSGAPPARGKARDGTAEATTRSAAPRRRADAGRGGPPAAGARGGAEASGRPRGEGTSARRRSSGARA